MVRLFVAFGLPDALRRHLSGLAGGVPGARWSKPEQYHVTLRFIGEVDGSMAHDIADTLGGIEGPPVEIVVEGLGTFQDGRKPNALWAGVRPNEALSRLQQKIETAMVRIGLEPERRKYKPHVTLARLNHGVDRGRLTEFMATHGDLRWPPFAADSFGLYSSFLSHTGAIYHEEANYPLGDRMRATPAWIEEE